MAEIFINPVVVRLNDNSLRASIYRIDVTAETDQLIGDYVDGNKRRHEKRWNLNGICRDGIHDLNMNLRDLNAIDLIQTAKKLRDEAS